MRYEPNGSHGQIHEARHLTLHFPTQSI